MVRQKPENGINSPNVNIESKNNIGVTAARGFLAAGIKAGLKKNSNYDLGCVYSVKDAVTSACFTSNKFAAAPVIISKEQLQKTEYKRLIVVNSGSANACTGEKGLKLNRFVIEKSSIEFDVPQDRILTASTGKIGVQLPIEKMVGNIKLLKESLSNNADNNFAKSIMTTDTSEKKINVSFKLGNKNIVIGGCAKGAGMINPNMATMLCFITTDVLIDGKTLNYALQNAVLKSFNSITVDGDMSTNDSVYVMANGMAENDIITDVKSNEYKKFTEKLTYICVELAKMIVKDGEGATKFLQIKVVNSGSYEQGKIIAELIANSNLVKTAFFGCDLNWGRIISSIGSAKFEFDPDKVKLFLNNNLIFEKCMEAEYDSEKLNKIMKLREIHVTVDMGMDECEEAVVWTSDLTYDYVKINAEYST
ncbi:bifunctional glutamate N-acetyltransferase/amino-acid acetyltransferase ArgJ [Candidatus Dependentiae bacterium]|nr:bifunctional glutamate N-acetyltransferase/amino-acid acetyltransferase ArgJ [Candidatus Dependentiae bacterium]